ncbi:MAG: flagellar hook-associated protein FlgL [Betaproteobacteria bacterium]|nr:flagellar hook-associated protein FlgL [Betaproteobacteria bacterium]
MRISTSMIYDKGVGTIQQLWSNILHAQQEVATGRRVLTPADDPIAASRALDVNKSRTINAQYKVNQDTSTDNLRLLENKLMGMCDILQYMRVSALGAGDGILSSEELNFFVIDMRSQFDALLALANTQDVSGNFLFSGYRADVQPFQGSFGNVSYAGDQGMRTIQVSSSRYMPVSLPGSDLFGNTRTMDGVINFFPGSGNIAGANVTVEFTPQIPPAPPAAADTGRRYEVIYDDNTGTYGVWEYVPGGNREQLDPAVIGTGPTFTFNGINVDASALVNDKESAEIFIASKNVFDNLAIFIDSLKNPGASGVISGVKFAIQNIDYALDTTLRVRAQVGSQLVELEQLGNVNTDMDTQYADTLSRLQDCDYAEAMSRLTLLRTSLEASQLSFLRISGLSLFNYLQ